MFLYSAKSLFKVSRNKINSLIKTNAPVYSLRASILENVSAQPSLTLTKRNMPITSQAFIPRKFPASYPYRVYSTWQARKREARVDAPSIAALEGTKPVVEVSAAEKPRSLETKQQQQKESMLAEGAAKSNIGTQFALSEALKLEDTPKKPETSERKKEYKILSIDGGGIRGIIPAMILTEIEKRTGKSISSLFDYIGGTSTGGILALGLSVPHPTSATSPLYSAKELLALYEQKGEKIFGERVFKMPELFVLLASCLFMAIFTLLVSLISESKSIEEFIERFVASIKKGIEFIDAYIKNLQIILLNIKKEHILFIILYGLLGVPVGFLLGAFFNYRYPLSVMAYMFLIFNSAILISAGEIAKNITTSSESAFEGTVPFIIVYGVLLSAMLFSSLFNKVGFHRSIYTNAFLKQMLKYYFNDVPISAALKEILITSYDIKNRTPHFFTRHLARNNKEHDLLMQEVGLATSAAPTYFNPVKKGEITRFIFDPHGYNMLLIDKFASHVWIQGLPMMS